MKINEIRTLIAYGFGLRRVGYILTLFAFLTLTADPGTAQTDDNLLIDAAVLQIVETIEIPATASGPLSGVTIEQGALITTDKVLATVNDDDARIKLDEARIELEIIDAQAKSTLDIEFAKKSKLVALADYRRAQESNRAYAGVVSDREMDRLKLLVEKSDAELEKIKFEKTILQKQKQLKVASVKKNEIEVERHKIRSAISGQVVEIKKRQGEWVNIADPVFKVVRLDKLRVEEYLPSKIASQNLTGAAAMFEPVLINNKDVGEIRGKVVFVSPQVDPLNSRVLVWIEFENADLQMRPGTKGRVTIGDIKIKAKAEKQASANR